MVGFDKYEIESKVISSDSLNMELKVEVYKNAKRKKSIIEYLIKCKKNTSNLFPVFRMSCMHPFELYLNLNISKNVIVEKAEGKTLSGQKVESSLLYFKEVMLDIEIPKQN